MVAVEVKDQPQVLSMREASAVEIPDQSTNQWLCV